MKESFPSQIGSGFGKLATYHRLRNRISLLPPGVRDALTQHQYRLLLASLLIVVLGWADLFHFGGSQSSTWWANLGWTLCCIPAIAGCLGAARRGGPGYRAWWCFATGCTFWLAGQLAWDYYSLVAQVNPTYPSICDAGYLAFVPCFLAGLVLLPRDNARQSTLIFLLLDMSICALALALTGIIADQGLLLGPTPLSNLGQAVALAYPVTYITLGLGVFLLMIRVPRLAETPGIPWLVAGLFSEGAAFIAWVPSMLTNTFIPGTPLDLLWMVGLLAIGVAGREWQPLSVQHPGELNQAPTLSLVILGLLPTILGTVVALIIPALAAGPVIGIVTLGARLLIILVALRQISAVVENARLYREAHRHTRRSEAVGSLLHALGHHLEVDALLRTGLQGIIHLTGASSASLFEYEAQTQTLIRWAGEGMVADLETGARVPLVEEYHAMQALQRRLPILLTEPQTSTERAALDRLGCQSILAVPLMTAGQPSGIIFINYREHAPAESTEERRFVQDVADALAVALDKALLYERAQTQAMRDPVTDLANHRAIHQALDAALTQISPTPNEPTTLLLIDVDNFKLFNDTYGHPTGDAVLRLIADHLKSSVREGALAGRYGGDEFAVVLPATDHDGGERVAQRIARAVASSPHLTPEGSLIPLTVSIGVATSPTDGLTRQALLAVADARMYVAKRGMEIDPTALRSAADLLGETTFGILEGLVSAVDAKDRYTREHSLDVTRYALLLADALHLDEQNRRTLSIAGPLHDVGKIAVPDRILRKPSALTAEEYVAIKAHVTYGVAIVRGMLNDDNVLAAIAHHHERYDGQGYPQGIRGEQTPLLGRIMQIADAVSAMTLDRPYRRGLPPQRLIAELQRGAGTQFDPVLVDVFISIYATLHPAELIAPTETSDPSVVMSMPS